MGELTSWIDRNSGVLPDRVIKPVSELKYRINDWAESGGTNATPENFNSDSTRSFQEVRH
jgi:hypothetical protein